MAVGPCHPSWPQRGVISSRQPSPHAATLPSPARRSFGADQKGSEVSQTDTALQCFGCRLSKLSILKRAVGFIRHEQQSKKSLGALCFTKQEIMRATQAGGMETSTELTARADQCPCWAGKEPQTLSCFTTGCSLQQPSQGQPGTPDPHAGAAREEGP